MLGLSDMVIDLIRHIGWGPNRMVQTWPNILWMVISFTLRDGVCISPLPISMYVLRVQTMPNHKVIIAKTSSSHRIKV